jgi:beta-phosphoglucomutase family hydrolase
MSAAVNWTDYEGVLFDLDGVVTPTAEIHERAWASLFEPWGFAAIDYLTYVDGKPRYDGVRSFLDSRGVVLPHGDEADPPGEGSICALGNRKNELFTSVLEREGIAPYPGTMQLLDLLDHAGIRQAIVSSSKNARAVLAAAGLSNRFPVVVDGLTAVQAGLPGKPDPAMFRHAANLLGVTPEHSAVVEDAAAGVASGRAGGFALVLGVDRGGNADALRAAGAHAIVNDLIETLPNGLT